MAEAVKKGVVEEKEAKEKDDKLPFPRATIVNMIRKHISPGKQIKGQVKDEMNKWLAGIVEKVAKKMDAHPYTYVDGAMFKEAIATYEKLEKIDAERERLIKYLEKIKSDCDSLEREVDEKFRL